MQAWSRSRTAHDFCLPAEQTFPPYPHTFVLLGRCRAGRLTGPRAVACCHCCCCCCCCCCRFLLRIALQKLCGALAISSSLQGSIILQQRSGALILLPLRLAVRGGACCAACRQAALLLLVARPCAAQWQQKAGRVARQTARTCSSCRKLAVTGTQCRMPCPTLADRCNPLCPRPAGSTSPKPETNIATHRTRALLASSRSLGPRAVPAVPRQQLLQRQLRLLVQPRHLRRLLRLWCASEGVGEDRHS